MDTAPHLCDGADCPGNANRERLKLLDEAAELIGHLSMPNAREIVSHARWIARYNALKVIE